MSQALRQDKQAIRQTILQGRQQFSSQDWQNASKTIQATLFEWPIFQKAQTLHIYLNQPREVETVSIVETCWEMNKTVVVPYRIPGSPQLGHSVLSSLDQLTSTKLDLREPLPETRKAIPLKMIDLVIVPGVAFDQQGGRLGYGHGYYDRFLSQTQAFFLGLSFSFQIVPHVPQAPTDIRMDAILTEDGFLDKTAR